MNAIIQTDNLGKTYPKNRRETIQALKGLTLSVGQGEVFGYLGPNGAGKTTTIRLLLDLIRPTTGQARLFGQDTRQDGVALRRRIGYLPGELNLWKNLTGQQVIDYFGKVRGGLDAAYVRQLTSRLELDTSRKMRNYSTGNKRKLGLALAMMHQPELLILDEPTSGLDPLMQQIFNELVLEAKREGRTVFLSSHILSEVQAICDRAAILRDGELQAVESVEKLTQVEFRWVTVRAREPLTTAAVEKVGGISEVSRIDDGGLKLRLQGDFDPLLRALAPYYVTQLAVQEPSLEEIFLSCYGGKRNGR